LNDFDTYQQRAKETADYTLLGPKGIVYPTLLLAEEAGEVAGKVGKAIRDCRGLIDDERARAIGKELGDCLWAISDIARMLGLKLSEIASMNIEKLESRKQRGVINGSGDDR
jgi:NTP pyrophosphatase (non-canonical NTP hydrolase)